MFLSYHSCGKLHYCYLIFNVLSDSENCLLGDIIINIHYNIKYYLFIKLLFLVLNSKKKYIGTVLVY